MAQIDAQGIYLPCPKCEKELKIAKKYFGERVACKFCEYDFRLDPATPAVKESDVYSKCPHCEKDLRFDPKYLGQKVACRFCGGKLEIQQVE